MKLKTLVLPCLLFFSLPGCAPALTPFEQHLLAGVPGMRYEATTEQVMDALEEITPSIAPPVVSGYTFSPFVLSNRDLETLFFVTTVTRESASELSAEEGRILEEEYVLQYSVFQRGDATEVTLQIAGLEEAEVNRVFRDVERALDMRFTRISSGK